MEREKVLRVYETIDFLAEWEGGGKGIIGDVVVDSSRDAGIDP